MVAVAGVWDCAASPFYSRKLCQRSLIPQSATLLFQYETDAHNCPQEAGPYILGRCQELQPWWAAAGHRLPGIRWLRRRGLGRPAWAPRVSPEGRDLPLRAGLRTRAPHLCQFHHFVPSRVRINAQEWREVSILSHSASYVCHDDQPCTGHRGASPEKFPVTSGCVKAALWFAIGLWILGTSDPKQALQAGWRQFDASSKTCRGTQTVSRTEVTENRYEQQGRKKNHKPPTGSWVKTWKGRSLINFRPRSLARFLAMII